MLRHECLIWDLVLVILEHVVGPTPVYHKEKKKKDAIRTLYIHFFFLNIEIKSTNLLLRKQFWMTLMMKDAASFSLKPGLNRCLDVRKQDF